MASGGSFKFWVDTTGFHAKIEDVVGHAIPVITKALVEGMQVAFRDSQRQVPVRTGVLKNSGQLKEPVELLHAVSVAITYGGAASAYAQYQHDNRTLHHPNGGKAGFVIDPIHAAVPDIMARMQAGLEKLGKG